MRFILIIYIVSIRDINMTKHLLVSGQYSQIGVLNRLVADGYKNISYKLIISNLPKGIKEKVLEDSTRRSEYLGKCIKNTSLSPITTGLCSKFKDVAYFAICFMLCMDNFKFDGVFLNCPTGIGEYPIIEKGNQLGIPTILLENGIWPEKWPKKNSLYAIGNPSNILCTSIHMKNKYLEVGKPESKLTLTGMPCFDVYYGMKRKEPNEEVTVLWAVGIIEMINSRTYNTQVPDFCCIPVKYKEFFNLCSVATSMPDVKFILSYKGWAGLDKDRFTGLPPNVKVVVGKPWEELIDKVDVVVGGYSTTVAESIYVGVPTITPKCDIPLYDYKGSVIEAPDWETDTVCRLIRDAVGSEVHNEDFINHYFSHNLDGKATDRVVEKIKELIPNV